MKTKYQTKHQTKCWTKPKNNSHFSFVFYTQKEVYEYIESLGYKTKPDENEPLLYIFDPKEKAKPITLRFKSRLKNEIKEIIIPKLKSEFDDFNYADEVFDTLILSPNNDTEIKTKRLYRAENSTIKIKQFIERVFEEVNNPYSLNQLILALQKLNFKVKQDNWSNKTFKERNSLNHSILINNGLNFYSISKNNLTLQPINFTHSFGSTLPKPIIEFQGNYPDFYFYGVKPYLQRMCQKWFKDNI